jgi:hypothetical protein
MPVPVLTTNAVIMCAHTGQVMLAPRQAKAICTGGPALCVPDLVGAPIVGCTQAPSTNTKPCTMIASTLPGSFSPTFFVEGRPVYLATLTGVTDGVPPSGLIVVFAGQVTTLA